MQALGRAVERDVRAVVTAEHKSAAAAIGGESVLIANGPMGRRVHVMGINRVRVLNRVENCAEIRGSGCLPASLWRIRRLMMCPASFLLLLPADMATSQGCMSSAQHSAWSSWQTAAAAATVAHVNCSA